MKSAAILTAILALGCVGPALADVPLGDSSLPTLTVPVPTPTLTTPTVPLPAPTLPITTVPVPAQTVPAPVSAPTATPKPATPVPTLQKPSTSLQQAFPSPVPHVPTSSTPSQTGSRSSSGSAGTSGSGPREGWADAPPTSPTQLDRFHSSRPWLAADGRNKHRSVVLKFRLKRKARIGFVVVQIFPVCRTVGSFSVVGHRGLNRVRFNGRLHGRRLRPGTYRITAQTGSGRMVQELVVVLVESRTPSPAALSSARQSDICSVGDGELAANVIESQDSSSTNGGTEGAQVARTASPSTNLRSLPRPSALGPNDFSNKATSPVALAMFGLAILLLGMAALPRATVPDARLNEALARRRAEIALGGVAALAAGVVALVLA